MVNTIKAVLMAAAGVLLLTAALTPDPSTGGCGTMANKDGQLRFFGKYFFEAEYAVMRDPNGVQQVSPTDSIYVVSDSATCDAVMTALLTELRKNPGWTAWEDAGYEFAVLRYGPYYAVHLQRLDNSAPDVIHPGYTSLLVLRKSDLALLVEWLV